MKINLSLIADNKLITYGEGAGRLFSSFIIIIISDYTLKKYINLEKQSVINELGYLSARDC